MEAGTGWWIAAAAAVLAELLTGTFYLLMIAVGLAAAALAAHIGFSLTAQVSTAAVVGLGALGLWHLRRPRRTVLPPSANPDVVLDVGQHLHVDHWHADGTARASYRGAQWQVRLHSPTAGKPASGTYVIHSVDGNVLVVAPLPTHTA